MRFAFHGLSEADFDGWIVQAKAAGGALDRASYLQLERPSENDPVRRYANVDPKLFNAILNMCVEPGKMCMNEMAAVDAKGGLGLAGIANTLPLSYDKYARRGAVFGADPSYVLSVCTIEEAAAMQAQAPMTPVPPRATAIRGAGLPLPNLSLRRLDSLLLSGPGRPSNS
jgi:cytochrome o ubiquinol oxidase subunit 2